MEAMSSASCSRQRKKDRGGKRASFRGAPEGRKEKVLTHREEGEVKRRGHSRIFRERKKTLAVFTNER